MVTTATPLVGLDVGSTSVKGVLLDPRGERTLRASQRRHHGRLCEAARDILSELWPARGRSALVLTGSGAPRVARALGAPTVHEVTAVNAAVLRRFPDAGAAFELGGQDAKALFLGVSPGLTMNDRCAAGTGVTLDRCLSRLGLSAERAARIAYDPALVRPLSTKCGVFAETDLAQLARAGVDPEALFVSVADAVVAGCLAVLARGRTPRPRVLLLGGPHVYFPALAGAFRAHLGALWAQHGVTHAALAESVLVPDDALYFAALGAAARGAAHGEAPRLLRSEALDALGALARVGGATGVREDDPLARSDDEADRARAEVSRARVPWAPRAEREARGYSLGIDVGSTRSKAVVLDATGALRASAALPSGAPAQTARALLERVRASLPPGARFASVGVTGYGAPQLGPLLEADAVVVETVAHAESARAVAPDVDLVCDLGGQDLKVLSLKPGGGLDDFHLSTQCSAGIGMALEALARELGVAADRYADRAFRARRAPYFGETCTVFLDANRVSFQRAGYTPDEQLAGLARALPRVLWSQASSIEPARAKVVLLQGGVQHNDAAVFAQLEYLRACNPDARVRVHPHPSLAGALGAALVASRARAETRRSRSLVVPPVLATRTSACQLCSNRCERTVFSVGIQGGPARELVTGHACEAGETPDGAPEALRARRVTVQRNLYDHEARALFAPPRFEPLRQPTARPVRIGVPRVLGMYRAAPLLSAYLQLLGIPRRNLVFSPPTSDALWREGARYGSTDPCFPVKVTLAHVHHLLREVHDRGRPLDALFVPRITHARVSVRGCVDCASCPVVVAAPSMVRAAFEFGHDALRARGVALLDPELDLSTPSRCAEQLHEAFAPLLGAARGESDEAFLRAREHALSFERDLQRRGRALLDAAAEAGRNRGAVLVIARPYHADPGVNHAVGAELEALGYPCLGLRALPTDEAYLRPLFERAGDALTDPLDVSQIAPETDNSGAAERLWAARFAAAHGRLGVLDLSSFKCGQDAPTYAPMRSLLRDAGVVTCSLHELDETRPRAGMRVRLATFASAMESRGLARWS